MCCLVGSQSSDTVLSLFSIHFLLILLFDTKKNPMKNKTAEEYKPFPSIQHLSCISVALCHWILIPMNPIQIGHGPLLSDANETSLPLYYSCICFNNWWWKEGGFLSARGSYVTWTSNRSHGVCWEDQAPEISQLCLKTKITFISTFQIVGMMLPLC